MATEPKTEHKDDKPKDPPEDWQQKGVSYPTGKPPEGVQSSTVATPELRAPNFVPPDPIPIMHHEPDVAVAVPAKEEHPAATTHRSRE